MLGRRLLSVILTVYIPTILLNIIGHITNYFKPFYFESAIGGRNASNTVLIVLNISFSSKPDSNVGTDKHVYCCG